MSRWGIKRELLLLTVLPAALIGLALYIYFTSIQVQLLNRSMEERGLTIATHLAPASEYGVLTGNKTLLQNLAGAILEDEDVTGIAIADANDSPLLIIGDFRLLRDPAVASRANTPSVCNVGTRSKLFCAPIYPTRLPISDYYDAFDAVSPATPGDVIGWIYVELSDASLLARRDRTLTQALLITLAILLVAVMLATFAGRRISAPVIALTDTIKAVAKGNLNARSAENAGNEIGTLQKGINAMIHSLKLNQEELQARIDLATAKLRSTLDQLGVKNRDLEKQRQRAQQANTAKSQFLATMSHEIRTPISGIIGMIELLENSGLDKNQREYLTNLGLAAKALRSLIDDILDFSRIEAGKLSIIEQDFNPQTVLEETALMLAPSAFSKGLELVCHVQPGFPTRVRGDALRLRQVLINLVANAVKFTEQGEIVVHAGLLPDVEGGSGSGAARGDIPSGRAIARFEIRDTGTGIAKDKLASIFESFTQVDNSNTRQHGGSGLGTTISRALITLMGGRIGVESEPGRGSLFWFELPWEIGAAPGPGELADKTLQGRRALILEDNASCAGVLREYCAALGLEVDTVGDETGLLDLLENEQGHGTVHDVVLLGRDGPRAAALARRLRARWRGKPPFLCHVAEFSATDDATAFDARLGKPVTLQELRACLSGLFAPTVPSLPHERPQPPDGPPQPRLRVLVAEDNAINAMVITRFLKDWGHEVTLVTSGHEVIGHLEDGEYDIVLMDLRMPGMDGVEATRRWRATEPEGHHVPIVALTANATTEDRERCLAAGMDDFLIKPVERERLLKLLAHFSAA